MINKLSAAAVAILALLAPPASSQTLGPPNSIACSQQAVANIASATTTSLVAGVAGKSIFICGWHVTSINAASTTFQFEYGTGASCTTPTVLTPAFNVTSTAPSADHVDYTHMQIPAGQQLCVVTGAGATGTAVFVWFNQF